MANDEYNEHEWTALELGDCACYFNCKFESRSVTTTGIEFKSKGASLDPEESGYLADGQRAAAAHGNHDQRRRVDPESASR